MISALFLIARYWDETGARGPSNVLDTIHAHAVITADAAPAAARRQGGRRPMRQQIFGATLALTLAAPVALSGCHRPPEPAPAAAACLATVIVTQVAAAVAEGVEQHGYPALHVDARACGEVERSAVAPLVGAAAQAALALAQIGAGRVEDPCAAAALAAGSAWAARVARELGEHLAAGEVVVDVAGEPVVCP